MTMKANMKFTSEEYLKLTHDQKVKLRAAKGLTPWPTTPKTTRAANSSTVTPTPVATTPAVTEPPADHLRQVLSNRNTRTPSDSDSQQVTFNGATYQRITNATNVSYRVNNSSRCPQSGSLIDGGANGGMSGNDVRVIETTLNHADVSGLADHSVTDLPIATVAGVLSTSQGPIIGIFHQYAHLGSGKTIHSANQMRHFGVDICEVPQALHGKQRIHHPDGYVIPLSIRNGLAYMDMHPPSDSELETLPHVFFTSDTQWDPAILDHEYQVEDLEIGPDDHIPTFGHPLVDPYGEFIPRECAMLATTQLSAQTVTQPEPLGEYVDKTLLLVHNNNVTPKQHDFNRLKPHFGFVPAQRIQKTLENTTQFCRMDARLPLRKHFKSRFPAANVPRRNEIVATDTFFSDVPAHDDGILGHGGALMVQVYCGTTSLITALYPMCRESEMPSTLLDFIRQWGAPNGLFSDNAKVQIGKTVQSIKKKTKTSLFYVKSKT
jgi:hypothetical protein